MTDVSVRMAEERMHTCGDRFPTFMGLSGGALLTSCHGSEICTAAGPAHEPS